MSSNAIGPLLMRKFRHWYRCVYKTSHLTPKKMTRRFLPKPEVWFFNNWIMGYIACSLESTSATSVLKRLCSNTPLESPMNPEPPAKWKHISSSLSLSFLFILKKCQPLAILLQILIPNSWHFPKLPKFGKYHFQASSCFHIQPCQLSCQQSEDFLNKKSQSNGFELHQGEIKIQKMSTYSWLKRSCS